MCTQCKPSIKFDELQMPELQPGVIVKMEVPVYTTFHGINKKENKLIVNYPVLPEEEKSSEEVQLILIPAGQSVEVKNPEGRIPVKIGKNADGAILYELFEPEDLDDEDDDN